MKVECDVECPVFDSFHVQQIAGMFDVGLKEKIHERFSVEVPDVDDEWRIGVIVGPSGSGKSTVARQAFGDRVYAGGDWPVDRAIVDGFGSASMKDVSATLTSVGFSSPPSWIKPYAVLSNGEKFRCDLARSLLVESPLIVFDEFTSVVDRTVARIGSHALQKSVRRTADKKFVAVACHYDIIDWLEPDWVLDMASGQLARGSLWRRPPISIKIYKSSRWSWRLFAKHHYLDAKDISGCLCYVAEIDGQPACFVGVRQSTGHLGTKRISRLVTLPDFQGVGIGLATLNAVALHTLTMPGVKTVTITSGHPAMMHALQRSPYWELREFCKTGKSKGTNGRKTSTGRSVACFKFLATPKSAPKISSLGPSTAPVRQTVAERRANRRSEFRCGSLRRLGAFAAGIVTSNSQPKVISLAFIVFPFSFLFVLFSS